MSRGIANMPGIGGSLGMCALCGDGFMLEILLGKRVQIVEIVGMDKDVCLHDKCLVVLEENGPDWHTLPDGPLRKAYEKAAGERSAQPPSADAVDPVGRSDHDLTTRAKSSSSSAPPARQEAKE